MNPTTIFFHFFLVLTVHQVSGAISDQTASTPSTAPSSWVNPFPTGKFGNPGANIRLSTMAIDAVHEFASKVLGGVIHSLALPNVNIPISLGVLTLKKPQITESRLLETKNRLIPPNRINSQFLNNRFSAEGDWQFRPSSTRAFCGGRSRPWAECNRFVAMSGQYRATIHDGTVESTNQLGRNVEAKPVVQTIDCKANFSQIRFDFDGANLTASDEKMITNKIRAIFEDAVCQILRTFIKETVNSILATFPTRIVIESEQYKLDYGLVNGGPKVAPDQVNTGLEGKYIYRGTGSVSFNAPERTWVNKTRMLSFEVTDFTFNTLFHQAHVQGYRYSSAELLPVSSATRKLLSLNCTEERRRFCRWNRCSDSINTRRPGPLCLGSLLENFNNIGDEYFSNQTGDLVYKTDRRAPSVYIQSDGYGFFDGSGGNLEIYGPAIGDEGVRQLLVRFDVLSIRGDFVPSWNGVNITGSIKFTRLHLDKLVSQPASMTHEWLQKFHHVAMPLLLESFNTFLKNYAQFPIPMLDQLQCVGPEFFVSPRTMQVDCDIVRVNK